MPYRVPPMESEPIVDAALRDGDGEISAVALLLWIASVVRVARPILEHERIEGEGAMALVCAVAFPLLAIALRTHKKGPLAGSSGRPLRRRR
jgi:hypothetical protein